MFFIFGINEGKSDLGIDKQMRCPFCGRTDRLQLVMTYTVFTLFFLPLFKWNKKYYVRFDCCSAIYQLNPEAGRYIEFYGSDGIELEESDLTLLQNGNLQKSDAFDESPTGGSGPAIRGRHCPACGSECSEDFSYCPHCGNKL